MDKIYIYTVIHSLFMTTFCKNKTGLCYSMTKLHHRAALVRLEITLQPQVGCLADPGWQYVIYSITARLSILVSGLALGEGQ